jgi:ribonuclease HI
MRFSFCTLVFLVDSDHLLGWQMTSESVVYTGFADGDSHHTLNLASAAWVIYEPSGQFLSSGSTCLGPSTNNIAEYSATMELLLDAISYGIQHLVVHLDSQLVVLQLNGQYRVHNPSILRKYLRVKLLERQFEFITYIHVPRSENRLADSLENFALDWQITHIPSR